MTWSAASLISSSPSVASAMTLPERAFTSYVGHRFFVAHAGCGSFGSRVAMMTTGRFSSISALGPCFISPAG